MSQNEEEQTFPKEWYDKCLDALQDIKDIELKGKEFQPRQKALKEMFKNGREPDEVIAGMEYLENEKGYDWTLMGAVSTHLAEAIKWKEEQEKEEKEEMKEEIKSPDIQDIKEFDKSYSHFKDTHDLGPWAFEYYLQACGIINIRSDDPRDYAVYEDSIDRYEKYLNVYERWKDWKQSKIKNQEVAEKMEELKGEMDQLDFSV